MNLVDAASFNEQSNVIIIQCLQFEALKTVNLFVSIV